MYQIVLVYGWTILRVGCMSKGREALMVEKAYSHCEEDKFAKGSVHLQSVMDSHIVKFLEKICPIFTYGINYFEYNVDYCTP